MHRPALKALQDFNVKLCADSGAGKGRDTTPEAIKAYRALVYERRQTLASLIHDAESELRVYLRDTPKANVIGHANGRYFIEGLKDALTRETRP